MSSASPQVEKNTNKRVQTHWNGDHEYVEELKKDMCSNDVLMEWLLVPANFREFRGEGQLKKSVVLKKIKQHFFKRGFSHRNERTISARLINLFHQHRKFKTETLEQLAGGPSDEKTIQAMKDKICPFFDEFDTLLSKFEEKSPQANIENAKSIFENTSINTVEQLVISNDIIQDLHSNTEKEVINKKREHTNKEKDSAKSTNKIKENVNNEKENIRGENGYVVAIDKDNAKKENFDKESSFDNNDFYEDSEEEEERSPVRELANDSLSQKRSSSFISEEVDALLHLKRENYNKRMRLMEKKMQWKMDKHSLKEKRKSIITKEKALKVVKESAMNSIDRKVEYLKKMYELETIDKAMFNEKMFKFLDELDAICGSFKK